MEPERFNIHIDPPAITSTSLPGQVEQIKSYLFQLQQQLNYALEKMGGNTNG